MEKLLDVNWKYELHGNVGVTSPTFKMYARGDTIVG